MSSPPLPTAPTPPHLLTNPSQPLLNPPPSTPPTSTSTYLLAGAAAGVCVDVVLFPLDTIKTRMQSAVGFRASGGFSNIYAGIASAAVGSAPSAALFFATYEHTKRLLTPYIEQGGGSSRYEPLVHCSAAAVAEMVACLVRVPTDNIKQKRQAGLFQTTQAAVRHIVSSRGVSGFYVGYMSTIMREIPFSLIQFPLYEAMKRYYHTHYTATHPTHPTPPHPAAYALMGSLSGSLAAALTTPMDVVKTRMMLRRGGEGSAGSAGVLATMRQVYAEGGVSRLFSGVGPRVAWIGLGGAVFLGGYETAKVVLSGGWEQQSRGVGEMR